VLLTFLLFNAKAQRRKAKKEWGAHAAGVLFSAARRKPRATNFLRRCTGKNGWTKVRASRPNLHAGRVRSPRNHAAPAKNLCDLASLRLRVEN